MQPLLFDQGLPRVAPALFSLGLPAHEVGGQGAPPSGSPDEENCKWCSEHGAVLVTHDRGRHDRTILDVLAQHHVHAIFLYDDLRAAPAHHLARAVLIAEGKLDKLVASKGLIHHRLRPRGGLENRLNRSASGTVTSAPARPSARSRSAVLASSSLLVLCRP